MWKIVSIFLVTVALITGIAICVYTTPTSPNPEIRTWYDLDAVRNNLGGNYTLMNNLDSTIPGYEELASPTANGGKGWEPIGTIGEWGDRLTGTLDGQGYEIRDLFINRPDEYYVGLFGAVGQEGVVKNIGLVNFTVNGFKSVGGLVGFNDFSTVSNSHSSGNVIGDWNVGGLVGQNTGAVSNSYATGSVTGNNRVGGLVGFNHFGTVNNSYSTSSVTGSNWTGGLVGENRGTVSNSFWDTETSGQATSDGGMGKTTAEMRNIGTFSGVGWNIIAVAPGSTNTTFTWNIVDGETYPFLGSTKSTSQNQQPQEDNFVISLTDSGEIVLSEHEIQAYHNDDNAFILNENGIKKWNSFLTYQTVPKLADSLFSREFVLKIEGQEICKGEFWSYASSTSFSGVVILDSLFKLDTEHNILWIKSFSMNSNTSLDAAISLELISFFEKRNLQK
ncbi:MAG TPA: GLUG motif-containing protein [Dehalococcoidia bacterium]|nr:GLUG motif-containing protein [Dehalococcoidia bacterium]